MRLGDSRIKWATTGATEIETYQNLLFQLFSARILTTIRIFRPIVNSNTGKPLNAAAVDRAFFVRKRGGAGDGAICSLTRRNL
jgi:hypothetical protein